MECDEDNEDASGPIRSLLGEGVRPFDPSTFCITRCPFVVATVLRETCAALAPRARLIHCGAGKTGSNAGE